MTRNQMRLAASLAVFVHAALLLCAAFLLPSPDDGEFALAVTLGVLCGQIALLAVWLVFSSPRLIVRLLVSVIGVILVGITFSAYVIRTNGPGEVCVVWGITCFAQWSVTQIPFWLTKSSGWVIVKADAGMSVNPHTSQFHIRHLFIWTTAIAVLFGIGNATSGWIGEVGNDFGRWVGFFGIVAATNVLMAGPVVWASLTRDGRYLWALVALLSFILLTPLEASLFRELLVSQMLLDNSVLFIFMLSSTYVATIVTALLVARGYRWRLVKVDARKDSLGPGSQRMIGV